ncbi:radical SAM protein [bacterium]|nr:radical SAM protein [bacterium]
MLLPLQKGIIYGPVQSRRLGISLGINLLPTEHKVCSFNCLYCQYGWTDYSVMNDGPFPDEDEISEALHNSIQKLNSPPAYLTFSGNGEPTLHPRFTAIVEKVLKIRDELSPSSKIAVLSNSSMVHLPEIRAALERVDLRIMKLDAGNPNMLDSYNKPIQKITLDMITEGLIQLKKVTIQSLFTGGIMGNYTKDNIQDLLFRLRLIEPVMVQIYTLDRGYPSQSILELGRKDLERIKRMLLNEDIPARVF